MAVLQTEMLNSKNDIIDEQYLYLGQRILILVCTHVIHNAQKYSHKISRRDYKYVMIVVFYNYCIVPLN